MRGLRTGIAVCRVVFAAAAVRAQVSGQIRGTAIDEAEKGLIGVKVEISEPSTGTRVATTDKEGRFRFVGLRPGVYKVLFTLESHADVQKNAVVHLDGTSSVNAKMFRVDLPK
jgi:hypothetical protein